MERSSSSKGLSRETGLHCTLPDICGGGQGERHVIFLSFKPSMGFFGKSSYYIPITLYIVFNFILYIHASGHLVQFLSEI